MAQDVKLDDTLERFEKALRQFEGAFARSEEERIRAKTYQAEADALREDRARIAGELDLLRTKAMEFATMGTKAAGKIDAAMSRIRAVIHSNSGA
jgi:Domain of unknown function (DUF4164)